MSVIEKRFLVEAGESELRFRSLQHEIRHLENELSAVLRQESENEMVMIELGLLSEPATGLFGLLSPFLIPDDLEESKETVRKRLEAIRSEKKRILKKIAQAEWEGEQFGRKGDVAAQPIL